MRTLLASWALLFALGPAFAAQREAVVPVLPQALPAVAPIVPTLPNLAVQAAVPAVPMVPTASSALETIAAPISQNQPLSQQAQAADAAMDGRAAAPDGGAGLYVLSKTVDRTAKIGPVWQALHYGVEAAIQVGKGVVAYKTVGWGGVAAVTALELPRFPLSVAGQSLLHLSINQALQRRRFMRELDDLPGVTAIKVLSAKLPPAFNGLIAQSQVSQNLVFLEAAKRPQVDPSFGEALPIDPATTRFRLTLSAGGETHPAVWEVSLADLFSSAVVPAPIAARWTAEIARRFAEEGWVRRFFYSRVRPTLAVQIALVGPDGAERPLGVLSRGRAAATLAKGRKGVPLYERKGAP